MKNQDAMFAPQPLLPMHLLSADTAVEDLVGSHGYDLTVGLMTRFKPHVIVCQLAQVYAEDFVAHSEAFQRTDFHVLRAAIDFDVFRLADPIFDPVEEMCLRLESADAHDRVAADPIASAIRISGEVASIIQKLNTLSPDQGKALWASLVFGQRAPLSNYDRLASSWWTVEFIQLLGP
jgi:hypothetical protein